MLKVCLKDLRAARWTLLLVLFIMVLYPIQPFWSGEILPLAGGTHGFIALFIIFFLEDRNKTEILYLSLPIQRRTIVKARFLLGPLMVVAGVIIVLVVTLLSSHLTENKEPRLALSVEFTVIILIFYSLGLSLYLLCYHRFGFGRGMGVFLISGIFLMTVIAEGLNIAAKSWSVPGAFFKIRAALGTPLFLLFAAVLVVVPYLISLRLSLRFYEKREF